ncbi:hypothetical protein Cgig2_007068 [Carnegiea gigantea]|uniref:Agglutinin domain-containing protein n=1 Tax=Carnegiea gigantea TaxID=171969 RepID=A0A9Q1KAY5_9CARY|nr:hypothetical protein Cgig2_007068 [Carnegiea gigantea]
MAETKSRPIRTVALEMCYALKEDPRTKRRYLKSDNWISPNNSGNNDHNILFRPVRVDSNEVALRNLGNTRFWSRLTAQGQTNCLNADSTTARLEATLEVEELVLSRELIYNVRYRLQDAKIFDQSPLISHVTVSPMTKVTAKLIASKGNYDVPFSYTQRDILTDGTEVTYNKNDGLYSRGNIYNVDVELTEEPIKN